MVWVIVAACLGAAALAAVGYYALRVFGAVKALSKEIGRAGSQLARAAVPVQEGLRQTQEVLAARSAASPPAER